LSRKTVRLRQREYGPFEFPPNVGAVYIGLSQGKSLQLRNMERFLDPRAPLLELTRDMEAALGHPLGSLSCYVTPPGGEGLVPHHDESEIFTLQVEGEKRWRLYHRLVTDRPGVHEGAPLGEPAQDLVLGPGDLLYHPRGLVHEVTSLTEASFSITVVFSPITWKSMLDALVADLSTKPAFIEELPAGVLGRAEARGVLRPGLEARLAMVREGLGKFSVEDFVEHLAARHETVLPRPAEGHFRELFRLDEVGPTTTLQRRKDVRCRILGPSHGTVTLSVEGADPIELPATAGPALARVLVGEPFRPADLQGLSDADRVFLAKILLRAGVVRFAQGT
jgi:hypothetical protein